MSRKKKGMKEENKDMTKKKVEVDEAAIASESEVKDETLVNSDENQASSEAKTEETSNEVLQKELDELNDKYLRLNAEFQNYRKRVEKEKSDIFKFGNEKLLIEMLPIMDNFERALSSVDEDHPEDKVLNGVKLIKKSLDDFFDKNGIKKIEAVNQPFDPEKHHAVMSEDADDVEADIVLEVFQDGYVLNEKVIRHSMVKVTK